MTQSYIYQKPKLRISSLLSLNEGSLKSSYQHEQFPPTIRSIVWCNMISKVDNTIWLLKEMHRTWCCFMPVTMEEIEMKVNGTVVHFDYQVTLTGTEMGRMNKRVLCKLFDLPDMLFYKWVGIRMGDSFVWAFYVCFLLFWVVCLHFW